jgi:ERCC4-type nuclease
VKAPPSTSSELAQAGVRGLTAAGYGSLEQLTEVTERELLRLHGVGRLATERLRLALQDNGMRFAPD